MPSGCAGQPAPPRLLSASHCGNAFSGDTRVGLANQLRDQLACFWPGAARVFSSVDSPIALAFLRRYTTPSMPAVSASNALTRS